MGWEHLTGAAECITAATTTGLLYVAWVQLTAIQKTSRTDFVHRLNAELFQDDAREIIRSLLKNSVKFEHTDNDGYFVENKARAFDSFDIDILVLGPLETIANLEREGIISLPMVYEMFGWYIVSLWESAIVKEYVAWTRNCPHGWDIYENFETLCIKVKRFEEEKHAKAVLWTCEIC